MDIMPPPSDLLAKLQAATAAVMDLQDALRDAGHDDAADALDPISTHDIPAAVSPHLSDVNRAALADSDLNDVLNA